MSTRLKTTTESSRRSNFDVRPQCCPGMRPKRVAPTAPHRGTLTSDILHDTVSSQAHPCKPLMWVGDPFSCRGVARHHVHMASHSTLSPLGPNRPCGHIECSALSQRAAMRADGRRRSAGWYCSRPSSSLPHGRKKRGHCSGYGDGRKRVTRCAADLQALTVLTQNSCSAARVRPAVAMNRLSHCEHRLERTASSSRLEELQDRGGAQLGDAADGGPSRSSTPSSFDAAVGFPHGREPWPCGFRISEERRWTAAR